MTARSSSMTLGRPLGAALALGGLVVVALSALGAGWAELSAATEERDAKADLLERGGAASRRVRLPPSGPAAADPFVPAETATRAAASLDATVRTLAVSSGASLTSSRAEVEPEEPGLGTRVEVQAVIEGQNQALQATLIALETGTPVVLVDALALDLADGEGTGDPQAPRLRLSLTLSAYWRPGRS